MIYNKLMNLLLLIM